jgi:hypothetical protein
MASYLEVLCILEFWNSEIEIGISCNAHPATQITAALTHLIKSPIIHDKSISSYSIDILTPRRPPPGDHNLDPKHKVADHYLGTPHLLEHGVASGYCVTL